MIPFPFLSIRAMNPITSRPYVVDDFVMCKSTTSHLSIVGLWRFTLDGADGVEEGTLGDLK